jgi:hypothetical protein
MLGTVQGAAVLANTLRDPSIMTSQIRRLERWIDSLAGSDKRPAGPVLAVGLHQPAGTAVSDAPTDGANDVRLDPRGGEHDRPITV